VFCFGCVIANPGAFVAPAEVGADGVILDMKAGGDLVRADPSAEEFADFALAGGEFGPEHFDDEMIARPGAGLSLV
jgi:hypothetical protein